MALVPLFPGVPGGPELLVILLLMVALFGIPVVVAVLGWRYISDDDQIEELEARVRELESQVGDDPERASERPTDDESRD
jgi:sec-independent protein translocase protein TatA